MSPPKGGSTEDDSPAKQLAFIPPSASPIRRQYLGLKLQHPGAILFFQLGDFYETFEEDARLVADVCEIALTSREMGRGERVPMAGVPIHAAEVYIGRLVERGHHIAICQQMEDPASAARSGSSVVRREVTRVITPGTLVDPALLTAERPNYLAAVYRDGSRIGIAHADVSTGEFACVEINGVASEEQARAELWRLRPAECLLADEATATYLTPEGSAATLDDGLFRGSDSERIISAHFRVASLTAIGLAERPVAARAVGAILRYLERTQARAADAVERLRVYAVEGHMVLDPATRDHLELIRGPRGRREGSLLRALDRTRTAMGSRLLAAWLGHPLLDKAQIEARLDAVEALVERQALRQQTRAALAHLPDLQRLAGRAAQRFLGPREALALAAALEGAISLRDLFIGGVHASLENLVSRIDPPLELVGDIRGTIVDDPPPAFGDGVIRRGRIAELDDLSAGSSDGRAWLLALERREKERTGIKNLKVGYNRVFGYYLEVSTASLTQSLDYYRRQESSAETVSDLLQQLGYQRRQTLTTVERFTSPELREHETRQAHRSERMAELERQAYEALAERIAAHSPRLTATAAAVAELDALASFATVAADQRYVRPDILEQTETEIVGGRHPVVEEALGWDAYIPADVDLRGGAARVVLLTGPNMAGKTTYGRMALLVTLLAQCGSFVPAERARIGLVDRIFLRSGAGDDIAGGQSTFMVEMTEAAAILRNATPRSLAFFDEIGRGTSTYDGMAIARAIVEWLADADHGFRAIFSTHYHELADVASETPSVGNRRMEVNEVADRVWFTYRVVPGSADRSYGVHVAELAGLPTSVITRAREVLATMEGGGREQVTGDRGQDSARGVDIPGDHPAWVYDLASLDVERTTPLEALQLLQRMQAAAAGLLSASEQTEQRARPPGSGVRVSNND